MNFLRQTVLLVVSVSLSFSLCDDFFSIVDTNIQRRSFCTNTPSLFFIRHTRCNIATNRRWRVYIQQALRQSIYWCKIAHCRGDIAISQAVHIEIQKTQETKINCSHRIGSHWIEFDFIFCVISGEDSRTHVWVWECVSLCVQCSFSTRHFELVELCVWFQK